MRELMSEFKELRLHGMAGAWEELAANGGTGIETSRWLIEHLLQAEHTDRVMRSISYQMHAARFPVHRDLAGFDFAQAKVDEKLIRQLADLSFTGEAHNVVFIGGTGTGKTHLATALGVSGISHWGKRVRFFSTVDLVNALEQEKAAGKAGRIALGLLRMDSLSCGIPDRFQKAARLPSTIHATSSSAVTFSAKSRSRFRETPVTLRRNHRSRWREIRSH